MSTDTNGPRIVPRALPTHIPSLDGLRAASICLVLLSHTATSRGNPIPWWDDVFGNTGNFGVRAFFVISGYLITTLLLKEMAKTRTVSLRDFYVRRTLRIFPAFYVFVFAIVGLQAWGAIQLMPGDLLAAFTYTMNFHVHFSPYVGHLWSLAVEEQFYLLWPLTVVLAGRRRMGWIAAGVVAFGPVYRTAVYVLRLGPQIGPFTFPAVADAIAIGCVLACVWEWLSGQEWYERWLGSRWFILIPLAAYGFHRFRHPLLWRLGEETLCNLCIVLTVDWCLRFPRTFIGRLLNARPVAFVGTLSYSLYLWQQLFLNDSGYFLATFPQNLAAVAVAACGSYYLVEKPFLRLKRRFERV